MTDQIPENARDLFPDTEEFLESVSKGGMSLIRLAASVTGLDLTETDEVMAESGVYMGAVVAVTELQRRGMLKAPGAES